MNSFYLAGDLGGTKMAAALVEAGGRIVTRRTRPTPVRQGIEQVAAEFGYLLAEVSKEDLLSQPEACGIAAPGLIDAQQGMIRYAANLGGVRDFPLRQRLQARLGVPVVMDNDLRLHALGERTFGAAAGCANFLFVGIGTGVGGALYLDNRLHRGARGSAGEIGHIAIEGGMNARKCTCGRRGCLEAYASGPAIEADFIFLAEQAGLAIEPPSPNLAEIAAWIQRNNLYGELARAAVARGAEALGRGLSIAANLFDPERIVLGGGVSHLGQTWLGSVRQAFCTLAINPEDGAQIQLSRLGGDAALYGAALLAAQLS
jgi:glucokinase